MIEDVGEVVGVVYLVHFSRPYRHARHYLGWTQQLEARIEVHRNGSGSPLMRAVTEAGIEWEVARTWEGASRKIERYLKDQRNTPRLCPICCEARARNEKPSKRNPTESSPTSRTAASRGALDPRLDAKVESRSLGDDPETD